MVIQYEFLETWQPNGEHKRVFSEAQPATWTEHEHSCYCR